MGFSLQPGGLRLTLVRKHNAFVICSLDLTSVAFTATEITHERNRKHKKSNTVGRCTRV